MSRLEYPRSVTKLQIASTDAEISAVRCAENAGTENEGPIFPECQKVENAGPEMQNQIWRTVRICKVQDQCRAGPNT